MEKHIDVMGYLLGALVFSIGFLSAREHAQLEAVVTQVRERSWHLRDVLNSGAWITPNQLVAELEVIRPSRDRVAVLSRSVNLLLFAATVVVFADAVRLIFSLDAVPRSALLIASCVFISGCAVTAIGEYDSRRVGVDERAVIERSMLGDLDDLRSAMAASNFVRVRALLGTLQEQHPNWFLLEELRSLVDLRQGNWDAAWKRVSTQGASHKDAQLMPVIASAAALGTGRLVEGHALLLRLERATPARSGILLERAMAVVLLHPDAIFCALPNDIAESLDRQVWERGTSSLDLRPADLAGTRALLELIHAWQTPGATLEIPAGPTTQALRTLIAEAQENGPDLGAEVDQLLALGAPALESLGLVCLARRRSRAALRLFERAIRIQPASASGHWGRAVACHQLAWSDAAVGSLRRAASLGLDEDLHGSTGALLTGGMAAASEDELMSDSPLSDLDKLRLSLVGVEVRLDLLDASPRQRFLGALIAQGGTDGTALSAGPVAPGRQG